MTRDCSSGSASQAGIHEPYERGQKTRNVECGTNCQRRAVEAMFREVSKLALADELPKGAGSPNDVT